MPINMRRFDSEDKNVFKYVFSDDEIVTESVLYRYGSFTKRTVICCSVMSGCPIGCTFCGSGKYFVRNLRAFEIVNQITSVLRDHKLNVSKLERFQIMFMSMGEPMLNFKEVEKAIRILHDNYPNAELLLSTTCPNGGDYSALNTLSYDIDKIGLQFSIHESTDQKRAKLIPTNNRMDLYEIADKGEDWYYTTGRKPFFNYCAHKDNTSMEDVDNLLKYFYPDIWECTISVICEKDESVDQSVRRQEQLATEFSSKMLWAGYNVRVFNPAGQDDIGGGCGQLWFAQEWFSNHPDKAKRISKEV